MAQAVAAGNGAGGQIAAHQAADPAGGAGKAQGKIRGIHGAVFDGARIDAHQAANVSRTLGEARHLRGIAGDGAVCNSAAVIARQGAHCQLVGGGPQNGQITIPCRINHRFVLLIPYQQHIPDDTGAGNMAKEAGVQIILRHNGHILDFEALAVINCGKGAAVPADGGQGRGFGLICIEVPVIIPGEVQRPLLDEGEACDTGISEELPEGARGVLVGFAQSHQMPGCPEGDRMGRSRQGVGGHHGFGEMGIKIIGIGLPLGVIGVKADFELGIEAFFLPPDAAQNVLGIKEGLSRPVFLDMGGDGEEIIVFPVLARHGMIEGLRVLCLNRQRLLHICRCSISNFKASRLRLLRQQDAVAVTDDFLRVIQLEARAGNAVGFVLVALIVDEVHALDGHFPVAVVAHVQTGVGIIAEVLVQQVVGRGRAVLLGFKDVAVQLPGPHHGILGQVRAGNPAGSLIFRKGPIYINNCYSTFRFLQVGGVHGIDLRTAALISRSIDRSPIPHLIADGAITVAHGNRGTVPRYHTGGKGRGFLVASGIEVGNGDGRPLGGQAYHAAGTGGGQIAVRIGILEGDLAAVSDHAHGTARGPGGGKGGGGEGILDRHFRLGIHHAH